MLSPLDTKVHGYRVSGLVRGCKSARILCVCRAFQRGECTRGAGCKFSHDEQRAADTGWGHEDNSSKWGHDKYEGPRKSKKIFYNERSSDVHSKHGRREEKRSQFDDRETVQKSRDHSEKDNRRSRRYVDEEIERKSREQSYEKDEKRGRKPGDDKYNPKSMDSDHERRDRKRSRQHESESDDIDEDRRGREKTTSRDMDSHSHHRKDRYDDSRKPSRD